MCHRCRRVSFWPHTCNCRNRSDWPTLCWVSWLLCTRYRSTPARTSHLHKKQLESGFAWVPNWNDIKKQIVKSFENWWNEASNAINSVENRWKCADDVLVCWTHGETNSCVMKISIPKTIKRSNKRGDLKGAVCRNCCLFCAGDKYTQNSLLC